VIAREKTSVVEGPRETTSRYVPGAEVALVSSALMKLFEAETTVSWANVPPEIPIYTDGAAPKFAPSIASVGLGVSTPMATTFEIVNCGVGIAAGDASAGG